MAVGAIGVEVCTGAIIEGGCGVLRVGQLGKNVSIVILKRIFKMK